MKDSRKEFEQFLDDLTLESPETEESRLLNEDIDRIDELFTQTVPKEKRAENEQFLTPNGIAEFLVNWAINDEQGSLFDPAVGTGVFLSKATEKAPELDLHGYDVDPLMLQTTRARLEHKSDSPNLNLSEQDFLSQNFPNKHDYLICNPPFKKFKEYENANIADWLKARYGVQLNQQANLYCAFLIHAYSFLKENGRAAFITPNEYLYANYGAEVKEFLVNEYRLEALILLDSEEIFDEILTTPVITLFSKGETDGPTKFVKLDEWPGASRLSEILSQEPTNIVPQNELDTDINWLNYFADLDIQDSSLLTDFDSVADIKRGIATGHNEFFLNTQSEIDQENLSSDKFTRVISKSGHCRNLSLTESDLELLDEEGRPTYLLYHVDEVDDELEQYLDYGRSIDVHDRYLAKNRTPWYRVERRDPAPILATTFSRDDMRFVLNSAGARNLTAFHSIYPHYDSEEQIKALLAFLNSGVFDSMMDVEKRVHGGLGKFEPNDLKRLNVLDLAQLDESTITQLASLFNELESVRRNGDDTSETIDKIDSILQQLL